MSFSRMQQRIDRLQARVGVIEQELDVQGAAASELSEQLQAVRTINQNQTRSIVDLWRAIDELRGEHPDEPDPPTIRITRRAVHVLRTTKIMVAFPRRPAAAEVERRESASRFRLLGELQTDLGDASVTQR